MEDLPLFPLDTVLFPGMPLILHIFEDRYKLMVGMCLEQMKPFGVVLIKEGVEAHGPLAEPQLVGCTARITQVERLGQGRMNISAIGRRRFRILSLNRELPYLSAKIAYYPIQSGEGDSAPAAGKLRLLVVRYMEELSRIQGSEFDFSQLPEEPVSLAYTAASLLRIPPQKKQLFLTAVTIEELLRDLRKRYKQEIAFLQTMEVQRAADQGLFSLN